MTAKDSSVDLLSKLVERFPKVPRYRFELCETYRRLGIDHATGTDDRERYLLLARQLGEQLVQEQRDVAPYRINVAHTYAALGMEYGQVGDIRNAEKFTRLALATHRSVVDDFPGLAPLSNRLSRNDAIRLGQWLLHLQRYEELIELLQPLGDELFAESESPSTGEATQGATDRDGPGLMLTHCGNLLLPAYRAVDDEVGYLVAMTWLGPGHTSPPGGPPGGGGPGRPFGSGPGGGPPAGGGPPGSLRGLRSVERMALSYDENKDGKITRTEVPARMSLEWFERMDRDEDGAIDPGELEVLGRSLP